MPYPHSLAEHVLPEFYAPAPESWERRLREISPILPNTSHLGFRKFAPDESWKTSPYNLQPDRPLWALYIRTPIRLIEKETAAGYEKHPSEHSTAAERAAMHAMVSNYQHFMWHVQGLYVRPFWLLQGEWGGTPMKFTDRERRSLDGAGKSSIPAPPGMFTPCPFDELVVKNITERDRLLQAGNRFDELERMDRTESKKAEDDAAELLYRETVLERLSAMAQPAAEFLKSQVGKREMDAAVASGLMRPAPSGLPNVLATWKDVYRETGVIPGASAPQQKKVFATS